MRIAAGICTTRLLHCLIFTDCWRFLALFVVVHFGDGTSVDELAQLQVHYESFGYITTAYQYNSGLTLSNTGNTDIDTGDQDVHIYVCLIRYVSSHNFNSLVRQQLAA